MTETQINSLPRELKDLKQWVCYILKPRGNGKMGKPPASPITGKPISWTDPKNFFPFDRAVKALRENKPGNLAGVGIVFTGEEPLSGIDIDDCLDAGGNPKPGIQDIANRLDSYTEVSPSGKGIRIIGAGKLPEGDKGGKHGDYEAYSAGRFLTITGNVFQSRNLIREFSSDLAWFRKTYATKPEEKASPRGQQDTRQSSGPLSDDDILKIVSNPKVKNSAKIQGLMSGGSDSEGDAALINCFAFYTKDFAQIERLMRGTKRTRQKWADKRGKDNFLVYEIKRLLKNYKGGSFEPKAKPQGGGGGSVEIDQSELKRRAEEVLTKYSNPCGNFDTSTLPADLGAYVNHICATTDTEPIIVTTSIIALISGFLKRHVYIAEDDYKSHPRMVYFQRLYANLNLLNVLESGLFKSTAQNKGMRIGWQKLDEIHEETNGLKSEIMEIINGRKGKKQKDDSGQEKEIREIISEVEKQSPFLPQKSTAEGLLEVELGSGRAGTIFLSEFGAWLKNLQKTYNIDLKALFTDLYDVPRSYSITTKGSGRITIERPFISICGLSTIEWVKEEIRPSDISSGFFARFLIFNPPGKKVVPPAMPVRRPGMNQDIEGKIKDILFNKIPENRPYVLTPEAYDRFIAIHEALYSSFDELQENSKKMLEPYLKRWSPYILKIGMIMQFMTDPDTNEIGVEAIMSAANIVEYAIKSTTYLFQKELGESKHQENCRRVLEFIAKRTREEKRTEWSNILASHLLEGGTKEYEAVILHLVEGGELEETPAGKKCNFRYTLKGC